MTSLQLIALKVVAAALGLWLSYFGYAHWRDGLIEQGHKAGKAEVQALWDQDKANQKKAEEKATADRLLANAAEKTRQDAANLETERKHHAELENVRRDLAAERLRRGKQLCGQGTPATTKTEGTGFRDDPNTPGELFPEQVEADIKQLIWETEEVAAAARSCQKFIRDNGLYVDPPRTETVEPKDPLPSGGSDAHSEESTGQEAH